MTKIQVQTICIYQYINKRKDRSGTNEPGEDRHRKLSARHLNENKIVERESDKVEFATISKNSPFQKYYINNTAGNSKRKKTRSKKHHTGSEIFTNDNESSIPEKNYSVSINSTSNPLAELYKQPNQNKIGRYKKKSLQYAMKRSRINDLIK